MEEGSNEGGKKQCVTKPKPLSCSRMHISSTTRAREAPDHSLVTEQNESVLEFIEGRQDRIRTILGLDKRSLALFRFLLGLVVVGDILDRLQFVKAHYSDYGVHSRNLVLEHHSSVFFVSIHHMSGSVLFQTCLFMVHALCALLFSVGYRTGLMNFIVWAFTISLHAYSPFVGHGGDVYCRVILFWAMFLPLGKVWSVDRALAKGLSYQPRNKKTGSMIVVTVGTVGIIFQIFMMYVISVFHKNGKEWTEEGSATYWALRLQYFAQPMAIFLRNFPILLVILTFAVRVWELVGPFLYIFPIATQYTRLFGVVGFFALHIGFGVCLRLGLFSFITLTAQTVLIPSVVWDTLLTIINRKYRATLSKSSGVYFVTSSTFSRSIAMALKFFFLVDAVSQSIMFESEVNSADETSGDQDDFSSEHEKQSHRTNNAWLSVSSPSTGRLLINTNALVCLCEHMSPLLWPIGWILSRLPNRTIQLLDDALYFLHMLTISEHRLPRSMWAKNIYKKRYKSFSKAVKKAWRFLVWLTGALFILLIFGFNMNNLGFSSMEPPSSLKWMVWTTRTDQVWNMFSPHPPKSSWWFVVHGKTVSGQGIELFKNGAITQGHWIPTREDEPNMSKPESIPDAFYGHRWFKYFEHAIMPRKVYLRSGFARYICREYNARNEGGDALKEFNVYIVYEMARLDGSSVDGGSQELWTQICVGSQRKVASFTFARSYATPQGGDGLGLNEEAGASLDVYDIVLSREKEDEEEEAIEKGQGK